MLGLLLFLCAVKLIMDLFLKKKWFLPFCLRIAGTHFGSRVARKEEEMFAFEPKWRLICFSFRYRNDAFFAPPTTLTCTLATFFPHGFFC